MISEPMLIEEGKLLLNTENPRFETVANQREAINLIVEDQDDKLYKLGQSLIQDHLDPTNPIVVTPHIKEKNHFVVLEGNRRLTALKLLKNPNLISESKKALLNKFKLLHKDFLKNPINKIPCVMFKDEKEAYKWIKLRHTGENEGIGTVPWNPIQKRRFEEKIEGKASYALQIIEFINKDKDFDPTLKAKLSAVPSSSLQRIISDKDIKKTIGIEFDNNKVVTQLKPSELRKPLTKIFKDLLNKEFTVKDIYYKNDRLNYIETFKSGDLPNYKNCYETNWELVSPKFPLEIDKKKSKISREIVDARNVIIPKYCIIHINQPRINKIYRELKDLDLKYFCNAGAITLRVFIELSIDEFIEKCKLTTITISDSLQKKVFKVVEYLKTKGVATKNELKGIETAVSNPNSILSINTFNAYVHNKHLQPLQKDLITTWDNIQPFVLKLWEQI